MSLVSNMIQKKLSIKEMVALGQFRKEKEYWLNQLSGQLLRSPFPYEHKPAELKRTAPDGPSMEKQVEKFGFLAPLNSKLLDLARDSDQKLHMILIALVTLLLKKYTGNHDVILGTPIYKQEAEGEFINTVLTLRNTVEGDMTFKELLVQVRQTLVEASQNQNYPIETLLYHLDIPYSQQDFSIFDVVVLLENLHDRNYIRHLPVNVIFSFLRTPDKIEGQVEYNALLYRPGSVRRLVNHFLNAARESLDNVNIKINRLDILSGEEKEKLLHRFNCSEAWYPGNKTIHRLFEEQAAGIPGHIAVFSDNPPGNRHITYNELNAKANRLAHRLRGSGAGFGPGGIAAIMARPSIERVVGMMAILKAGAAYMPLNPGYSRARIQYMLKDNGVTILLREKISLYTGEDFITGTPVETILAVDDPGDYGENPSNFTADAAPRDLAYVMYTSGTTGKPKGVLIEHGSVVNLVHWFSGAYGLKTGTRILGLTDYDFDPSVEDIFAALLYGAALYTCGIDLLTFMDDLRHYIQRLRIDIIDYIPPLLNQLLSHGEKSKSLKVVISGGQKLEDQIKNQIIGRGYTLYNNYGPTEVTVDALSARCSPGPTTLGRSIANVRCYIFDKDDHLAPVGVPGELCVAGTGVARGYLNNIELTAIKFGDNPLIPGERMYRTGDLAKWQADGNVEFLGRIDLQLKIRGLRIEPGEIEHYLLNQPGIKAAVVTAKEDKNRDKFLCAYIVSGEKLDVTGLRKYLAEYLPNHMIPSHFVQLDRIPRTPEGKTDFYKLPDPGVKTKQDYTAPRNHHEEILARTWSEVLGIDKQVIGIDYNFFELGGHSLKAIILAERIHKTLNVKLQLAQIFKTPTIRELAAFMNTAPVKEKHTPIEPVEKSEYYPLSSAQKRLYILQQMDQQGTAYNIPAAISFSGHLDKDKLEHTFRQLIKRHESLRTSFEMIKGEPVQRIHHRVEFKVEYYDGRAGADMQSASNIEKRFVRHFHLSEAPLLRAAVQEQGGRNYLLMVDMHHIISDGLSALVLQNDFAALYNDETLPTLRLQYKDFSQWQNHERHKGKLKGQEEYWLKEFKGKIPVLNLPTDYPRPGLRTFAGRTLKFEIPGEENARLNGIALKERATLFMVYLAITNIFLSKISGQEDIVIGVPVVGRKHADLEPIIGMFVNTLALRSRIPGEETFGGFLKELKNRTLEAFDNQDFQFEDLVDHVLVARDPSRNPIFDLLFTLVTDYGISPPPGRGREKELKILEEENTDAGFLQTTAKFDLKIVGVEQKGKSDFFFEYNTTLFKKETIERLISYFKNITNLVAGNPGIKISQIQMLGEKERERLIKKMRGEEDKQFIAEMETNPGAYSETEVEFDF